ncbi:hypothetical protein FE257_011100 [Aspergillus nanangensis]|uniref:ER-bound oxygenase mpaB/mpaB'/Rubber oxygenase catalytic domain-containing protein n=1 Tax=Aspergillus nanangensis TaxID=2582783 RepID=A0AAD4GST5_ASPNN|nr:hypothetical protein FE257_011100 [Aspergillus nanangensis]
MSEYPIDPEHDRGVAGYTMFGATELFHKLGNNCPLAVVIVLTSYLVLVKMLRYRRRAKIEVPFANRRRPLSSMTVKEAHEIMTQLQELEFPYAFAKARQMALLKAGGIPTMSKLFAVTGQNNKRNAGKRAVDTEILLRESQSQRRDSNRYASAVARMNYLHARYRRANKITDDDLLHTLGDGLAEILNVIEREEWRKLTDVEKCALGIFHKNLGEDMRIPFDVLPSKAKGWEDGFHFALELSKWTIHYEEEVARPTETNDQYVRVYVDSALPRFMKSVVRQMLGADLDDLMRTSLGIESPTYILSMIMFFVRGVRKCVLRYLALPRPSFLAVKLVRNSPNRETNLYNFERKGLQPWYIRPTLWANWGPGALLVRLFGGKMPGSRGDRYLPQGYDLMTIGPDPQKGKGLEEMGYDIKIIQERVKSGEEQPLNVVELPSNPMMPRRSKRAGRPRLDDTSNAILSGDRRTQVRRAQHTYRRRKEATFRDAIARAEQLQVRMRTAGEEAARLSELATHAQLHVAHPDIDGRLKRLLEIFADFDKPIDPAFPVSTRSSSHTPARQEPVPNVQVDKSCQEYSLPPPLLARRCTYAFQEVRFARQLQRYCLEHAYRLFTESHSDPREIHRVFRLVPCVRAPSKTQPRFRDLLMGGRTDSLEVSGLPFYSIGGAGTHFPDLDKEGNAIYPANSRMPRRILGTLPYVQEGAMGIEHALEAYGLGGEWFDSRDVEGYLSLHGVNINGGLTPTLHIPREAAENSVGQPYIVDIEGFFSRLLSGLVILGRAPGFRKTDVRHGVPGVVVPLSQGFEDYGNRDDLVLSMCMAEKSTPVQLVVGEETSVA